MADGSDAVNRHNRGDHVSIMISDHNKLLAASIKAKLDTVSASPVGRYCCIYKVHEKFRKTNEYAYTPELIAIGPFHHGKVVYQATEDHKLRYMAALFKRLDNGEAKLEECVQAISDLEVDVRKCYSIPVEPDKDKFVQMMILDGIFIIELFRKSARQTPTHQDDPVFYRWSIASLVRDLILLENQLPMFVLKRLFDITNGNHQGGKSINELAICFFNPLLKREESILANHFNTDGKHLLDLLSKTFHYSPNGVETNTVQHSRETGSILFSTVDIDAIQELKHIPCVAELRRAGVKFRKCSQAQSFLDIRFHDGVMEIPPIIIQDQTDSLLRNFIASEQCDDGSLAYMTSYAFLMDSLINSSSDVEFLCKRGIIINYLGDHHCVSSMFNKLCNEVTLIEFHYSKLCGDVNTFYNTRWHVWIATLKRDYFQSPWAAISVIAAVFLIFLTLSATLFAVLSFAVHHS